MYSFRPPLGCKRPAAAPAGGTDPNSLPEFNAHWDFSGVSDVTSIPSKTAFNGSLAWLSDYDCDAPDPEAPNPNCQYGPPGYPGAAGATGLRSTTDAGYILRETSEDAKFKNLQLGFTKQVVVTVHGAAHELVADPSDSGNFKTEILLSDNRGSAGTGFGDIGGTKYVTCWMNYADLDVRGLRHEVTLGVKTLMTWNYVPPATGSSGDGVLTFEWGALTASRSDIVGYRTKDARLAILGVVRARSLWEDLTFPTGVRSANATIHQALLMSPEVDKATYDETGAWLMAQ